MAGERADAHALYRREGDPRESDFRRQRYAEEREVIIRSRPDAYTRWIVGTVGAGIITLLGILAMRDRQSIDQTLVHHDARLAIQEQTAARHESDLAVLKSSGERQSQDIAEMKVTIGKMDEKLDRVLAEVRKVNR